MMPWGVVFFLFLLFVFIVLHLIGYLLYLELCKKSFTTVANYCIAKNSNQWILQYDVFYFGCRGQWVLHHQWHTNSFRYPKNCSNIKGLFLFLKISLKTSYRPLKFKRFADLRLFYSYEKGLKTSYRPLKFKEVHHPPLTF